jgi:hypothetical protein
VNLLKAAQDFFGLLCRELAIAFKFLKQLACLREADWRQTKSSERGHFFETRNKRVIPRCGHYLTLRISRVEGDQTAENSLSGPIVRQLIQCVYEDDYSAFTKVVSGKSRFA